MSERPKPNWLTRAGIVMVGVGAISFANSWRNIGIDEAKIEVIEDISASLPRASSEKLAKTGVIYQENMERSTDLFAGSGLLMLEGSILLYISKPRNKPRQQESQNQQPSAA